MIVEATEQKLDTSDDIDSVCVFDSDEEIWLVELIFEESVLELEPSEDVDCISVIDPEEEIGLVELIVVASELMSIMFLTFISIYLKCVIYLNLLNLKYLTNPKIDPNPNPKYNSLLLFDPKSSIIT